MLLAIHLFAAGSSLLYVAFLFLHPSTSRFYLTYSLVALTIVSGTALVLLKRPEHLATVCTEGLAYLTFMSFVIVAARIRFHKQVLQEASINKQ
jgi:hypothetical protein